MGQKLYRLHQVLLLSKMSFQTEGETDEYEFVQYMEYKGPLDKVHSVLGRICLRWSIDSEMNPTTEGHANSELVNRLKLGEWIRLEPFDSMKGTVHGDGSNPWYRVFYERAALVLTKALR